MLNKGTYAKEEYETFRAFWLDVVKYDKSKIVLKTKS
jgi:glucan biosynthesis protein